MLNQIPKELYFKKCSKEPFVYQKNSKHKPSCCCSLCRRFICYKNKYKNHWWIQEVDAFYVRESDLRINILSLNWGESTQRRNSIKSKVLCLKNLGRSWDESLKLGQHINGVWTQIIKIQRWKGRQCYKLNEKHWLSSLLTAYETKLILLGRSIKSIYAES